jgi:hypothetical protein
MKSIRMRAGALLATAALILAAPAIARAQQPASVRVAAVPALVNCGERACFRLLLNAFDAEGKPMPVSSDALFEISEAGAVAPPVDANAPPAPGTPPTAAPAWWQYRLFENLGTAPASPAANSTPRAKPRYLLLVVDTSGSMLEPIAGGTGSKFDAAVAAIRANFLQDFKAGVDRMAIVGFDSRRVRARIEGSTFEDSLAAVQSQLDGLAPSRQGNTALYSAVDAALDKLKALGESGRAADAQVQLLVFTDGKNDVKVAKGDDAGLLEGASGLAAVEAKVRTIANAVKGLEVITVGLGEAGRTYDPEALRQLAFPDAKNAMDAASFSSLRQVFKDVRAQMLNRVFLTFGPVRSSKDELTRPIAFTVTMRTPAVALTTQSLPFQPPPIGVPTWDYELTPTERLDFAKWLDAIRTSKDGSEVRRDWDLPPWAKRLIVLATFGATLAVLWFGLPRLVWPERYVPRPSFQVASAPAGRAAARPAAGRPATQKGVTITGRAVSQQRGGSAAPPTVNQPRIRDAGREGGRDAGRDSGRDAGRDREPPAPPPARPRVSPPAAPQRPAREPFVRGAGDATVFVPPNQNRGGDGDQ